MESLANLYKTFDTTKFWIIVAAISGGSVIVLPELVESLSASSNPGNTVLDALFILIATFGACLMPFALWQHIARRRFYDWLQAEWSSIEAGVVHPDGYIVTLDTKLVKYQAVFSAVLATVSFESRPYVYEHRTAGAAQISFTILSLIFGWWFVGLEGVVETSKAVYGNSCSNKTFTLRQLLEKADRS